MGSQRNFKSCAEKKEDKINNYGIIKDLQITNLFITIWGKVARFRLRSPISLKELLDTAFKKIGIAEEIPVLGCEPHSGNQLDTVSLMIPNQRNGSKILASRISHFLKKKLEYAIKVQNVMARRISNLHRVELNQTYWQAQSRKRINQVDTVPLVQRWNPLAQTPRSKHRLIGLCVPLWCEWHSRRHRHFDEPQFRRSLLLCRQLDCSILNWEMTNYAAVRQFRRLEK